MAELFEKRLTIPRLCELQLRHPAVSVEEASSEHERRLRHLEELWTIWIRTSRRCWTLLSDPQALRTTAGRRLQRFFESDIFARKVKEAELAMRHPGETEERELEGWAHCLQQLARQTLDIVDAGTIEQAYAQNPYLHGTVEDVTEYVHFHSDPDRAHLAIGTLAELAGRMHAFQHATYDRLRSLMERRWTPEQTHEFCALLPDEKEADDRLTRHLQSNEPPASDARLEPYRKLAKVHGHAASDRRILARAKGQPYPGLDYVFLAG